MQMGVSPSLAFCSRIWVACGKSIPGVRSPRLLSIRKEWVRKWCTRIQHYHAALYCVRLEFQCHVVLIMHAPERLAATSHKGQEYVLYGWRNPDLLQQLAELTR